MSVLSYNIWSMVDDKRHSDTEYISEKKTLLGAPKYDWRHWLKGRWWLSMWERKNHGSIAFIKSSNILVPLTKLGTDEEKKVSVSWVKILLDWE